MESSLFARLSESIFARAVWALLAIAGAAVIAWLKKRGSAWTGPAMYGGGAFLMLISSLVALQFWLTPIPKLPESITPENVEGRIKTWLDNFGLGSRNEPVDAAYFRRVVTMRNGNIVVVERSKARDRYLVISGLLVLSKDQQEVWSRLPKNELVRKFGQIQLELARSKIVFTGQLNPLALHMEKRLPITDDLTESVLIEGVDELDSHLLLVRQTIALGMPLR